MFFSAACRTALSATDPTWGWKACLRLALVLLDFVGIIMSAIPGYLISLIPFAVSFAWASIVLIRLAVASRNPASGVSHAIFHPGVVVFIEFFHVLGFAFAGYWQTLYAVEDTDSVRPKNIYPFLHDWYSYDAAIAAFLWLATLLHFAFWVWALVDIHVRRRVNHKKQVDAVAEDGEELVVLGKYERMDDEAGLLKQGGASETR